MIIDKRGKLFGTVSIFDILAVLLIFAIIISVNLMFRMHEPAKVNTITRTEGIDFVLNTNNIEAFAANAVKIGDLVEDNAENIAIGRVTAVEIGKSISYTSDSKGKVTASSIPGHVSLKITVAAKGIYTDTGVTLGKSEYYLTKLVEARVGKTFLNLRVMDLKKAKG